MTKHPPTALVPTDVDFTLGLVGEGWGRPKPRELYLLVLLQDGLLEAEEDVYCSLVVVLQGRPNHDVVVGVLVEVGHGGDAGAEAGVLVALQVPQGPAGNKAVLWG